AGVAFLGAYVLAYALWTLLHTGITQVVIRTVGGHGSMFWLQWGTFTDIVIEGLSEPLRMCLLALAFHRCLALFRSRASAASPDPGPGAAPAGSAPLTPDVPASTAATLSSSAGGAPTDHREAT